ncbi:MAG: DNA topoisomerase IB [Sphingobacteriales bacterium JAD_PAG50586_3]|nr:MAG: DNA topoisomerase IB [Sphingobacteriales bacterium JAD_PAG50586_3]
MTAEALDGLLQEVKAMKLAYVTDKKPGYTREKKGDSFIYLDKAGNKITDEEEIKRIRSLVIPPAWTSVWICPKPNGHLQVTGIDVAGRKQYKYHKLWSEARNERKHNRMADFAKALPLIREQVEKDLRIKELTKEKVLAIAVSVIDKTYIRVGNSEYAKLYGSFGLTSLRDRHLKVSGNTMKVAFVGKKGVFQEITLTHARLSKLMKKLQDIPGQELFQYYDKDGNRHSLESGDVNAYLKSISGKDFTAKDFRTWWGTVTAAARLAELLPYASETEAKRNIVETLDFVASKLGNTRTVCKKYYVHPTLLSRYEDGKFDQYVGRLKKLRGSSNTTELLEAEERLIGEFIKAECS